VVNAIAQGDKIDKVTIIRNGQAANAFKADQAAFDTLLREATTAEAARQKAARDADLAQIETKYPGTKSSSSGVRYIIQKTGTGPKPEPGKTVKVNYTGMLLSGTVFDSTDLHGGDPLEFQAGIGQVIRGWDEAVLDMNVGEKRLVVIPPELAYGERGAGNGLIPGNSYLVFEMELVGIE
jgi:peptidylprolyl isomerase